MHVSEKHMYYWLQRGIFETLAFMSVNCFLYCTFQPNIFSNFLESTRSLGRWGRVGRAGRNEHNVSGSLRTSQKVRLLEGSKEIGRYDDGSRIHYTHKYWFELYVRAFGVGKLIKSFCSK